MVPEETLYSSMWYYDQDITKLPDLQAINSQFHKFLIRLSAAETFFHVKYTKLQMSSNNFYYTKIVVSLCEDKCLSKQYVQYVYPALSEDKYS